MIPERQKVTLAPLRYCCKYGFI